jgi:hypothetical protein
MSSKKKLPIGLLQKDLFGKAFDMNIFIKLAA